MKIRFDNPLPELKLFSQGKVRDMYDLGEHFLMVATDRISAFDVVLPTTIPGKGKILNQLSAFWFKQIPVENHMVTANVDEYPQPLQKYADYLRDRSMIVKKAMRLDLECIARGYLVGSGWKEYQKFGTVCLQQLPMNLKLSSRLNPPIYTPSTKADDGHDENISFEQSEVIVGSNLAKKLRDLTLDVYTRASQIALSKGIILADTKFEFGLVNGQIILIDEVLTPDSSRYWPAEKYQEGNNQESFDKQYLRDWLEKQDWNKNYPGPTIPADVVKVTQEKYVEIYTRLTGQKPNL